MAHLGVFWVAVDARLTKERLSVYPATVVVVFLATWAVSLRSGLPLPDHLARWTAGRLVAEGTGSALYDPGVQSALQAQVGATGLSWFVSPPQVALFFVPFGALPYAASAVAWTVLSMLATVWGLRAAAGLHPTLETLRRPGTLLVALSCQPVLELFGGGQDSGVVLAVVVGMVLLRRRGSPFAAGLLLALALCKPQLIVLLPAVLLLLRDWRALAGLATGATVLVGTATAVLGYGVWGDWLRTLRSPLYLDEVVARQAWKNTTVHGFVESLVPGTGGWIVQVVWAGLAIAVLALTAVGWRGATTDDGTWLLLVVAPLTTVLVTPHAMVYDLVLVLPGVVWLAACQGSARLRGLLALGYVLLFIGPVLRLATADAPWPISMLAAPWVVPVLAAVWWSWLRRPLPHQKEPTENLAASRS